MEIDEGQEIDCKEADMEESETEQPQKGGSGFNVFEHTEVDCAKKP